MQDNKSQQEYVDWIEKVKILQKVAVVNSDNKVLALKRSAASYSRANCWDLPGGSLDKEDILKWKENSGKGDENDILIKEISRELNEETGLNIAKFKTIKSASGFNDKKSLLIIAIGYVCYLKEQTEILLSAEHSEYQWVNIEEFLELEIGNDGGLIAAILSELNQK